MHPNTSRQEDPIWIDWPNECVGRAGATVRLTPKAFAVLRTLAAHAGQLVPKAALLEAVWPEAVVSEAVLTECIRELRRAFGETARTSSWIQTVHRRGYRFAGRVQSPGASARGAPPAPWQSPAVLFPPLPSPSAAPEGAFVGRAAEVAQLHARLVHARGGRRQVVFITGEPGMGKTTLVQTFAAQVAAMGGVWIAQGQCFEHYGVGEAYLPLLEVLSRLCRAPGGAALLAVLEQQAPTWLAQMPAFLSPTALEAVQRRVLGATHTRMLRELVDALDRFTRDSPLMLVLEDLHWSDAATLDLLSALARRPEPAQLLVLGTYRPVEVIVRQHPLQTLQQDLAIHRQCTALPLELLTTAEVTQYLVARFGAGLSPTATLRGLAQTLHRRTDGNPLFLVTLVDDLVRQGTIRVVGDQGEIVVEGTRASVGMPESLRQMILQQCDALSLPDQEVLEAASVAGAEYGAATVATGLGVAVEVVEARCAALARRGQFLTASGLDHWPDGTVTASYRWRHALYQEVLYDRVSAGHRVRLHRRMGARLEAGYGAQAGARAAALADHFVRGLDTPRAVRYLQQAAQNALQRHGYQEAIRHLHTALVLLQDLPDAPARVQQELALLLALGRALVPTQGFAAPEVAHVYDQARTLCQQVGETPELFPVMFGLRTLAEVRGDLTTSQTLGGQLLALAQGTNDPVCLLGAYQAMGITHFLRGEAVAAHTHLAQGLTLYSPSQHRTYVTLYGDQDPGVSCRCFAAWALWVLGVPDQALGQIHAAQRLAQELAHPYAQVWALLMTVVVTQLRGEGARATTAAQAAVALATAQEFTLLAVWALMFQGWTLGATGDREEGIAQLQQGLSMTRVAGVECLRPWWLMLLAELMGHTEQPAVGLGLLAEAQDVMETTGEQFWNAERWRLQGVLLLLQTVSDAYQAETCFQHALAVARHQQAKSLELRAAVSLARLWQSQGKQDEARALLAPVYGWFTEGFDTADLKDAKALLDELGG